LLDQAAPQLIAGRGIGYVIAAAAYVAWSGTWSNGGSAKRCAASSGIIFEDA
jgi:hypothetical protein